MSSVIEIAGTAVNLAAVVSVSQVVAQEEISTSSRECIWRAHASAYFSIVFVGGSWFSVKVSCKDVCKSFEGCIPDRLNATEKEYILHAAKKEAEGQRRDFIRQWTQRLNYVQMPVAVSQ